MKADLILKRLEKDYPLSFASSWDNVGVLVGDRNQDVKKVYIAVDATEEIIDEAVKKGADMLITHHPMIFSPLKRITNDNFIAARIIKLIKNDILYCAFHTNYDVLRMADLAAGRIGLQEQSVLEETCREKLYKLAVFVPEESAEEIRLEMGEAGAGAIGNYSHCTFSSYGKGSFLPQEGSHPYIGEIDKIEYVNEVKIETIVSEALLPQVIHTMKEVHPYEEPAYDIFEEVVWGQPNGFGRAGKLPQNMTLENCAEYVKEKFDLDGVQVFGDLQKEIRVAAISPGSGKSMIDSALKVKADVMITGDIGHHEGIDAAARGLAVIDAGHYGLEHIFVEDMKAYLQNIWKELAVIGEPILQPFHFI